MSKNTTATCLSSAITSVSKEKETFQDELSAILDTIAASPKLSEIPEVGSWIKEVLKYNLAGSKMNIGVFTVLAYKMSEKPENITEESMRLARVLGWCVEILQAYYLVIDDIMDGSTTRRGILCWYRLPDIGLGALNDSSMIYQSMHEVLYLYFRKLPQYLDIIAVFNEQNHCTLSGQYLDDKMTRRNKNNYSLFTKERYELIAKYKTAYFSFRLPVLLGLTLARVSYDSKIRTKIDHICFDLGIYIQMQNDFEDCFIEEAVTGKAGTDIQEGKCSWLAVTALQLCNPAQRALFEQCYGSDDPANVQQIKRLYEQLNLPHIYRDQERAKYEKIFKKIQDLENSVVCQKLPKLLTMTLDTIFNCNGPYIN